MMINENEKRDKIIPVKCNKHEREVIEQKASALNMKIATYMRFVALNTDVSNFKL